MIEAKTALEVLILSQPEVQQGLNWGRPRPGHPEGNVGAHVKQILTAIDNRFDYPEECKPKLRLIAILHDTFKYKVDSSKPKTGENNHAMIARRFAERFIDDERILDIIEFHDKYYSIWLTLTNKGFFREREFHAMMKRIQNVSLLLKFIWLDGSTEGKDLAPRTWFEDQLELYGYIK